MDAIINVSNLFIIILLILRDYYSILPYRYGAVASEEDFFVKVKS